MLSTISRSLQEHPAKKQVGLIPEDWDVFDLSHVLSE
jgi:hypothetical protein